MVVVALVANGLYWAVTSRLLIHSAAATAVVLEFFFYQEIGIHTKTAKL